MDLQKAINRSSTRESKLGAAKAKAAAKVSATDAAARVAAQDLKVDAAPGVPTAAVFTSVAVLAQIRTIEVPARQTVETACIAAGIKAVVSPLVIKMPELTHKIMDNAELTKNLRHVSR